MFKIMIAAVAAAWVGFAPTPTYAAPVDLDLSLGQIIQVYDCRGVYSHRGPSGGCRRGGHCWRN